MGRRRPLLLASIATAGLFAGTPAFALRGESVQGRMQPPEFGRRDLSRVADPIAQSALTAGSPAWAEFRVAHPGPWRVTWDDRAGTPRAILGGTIALLPAGASAKDVERASRAFLNSVANLSGVSDALLRTNVLSKVGDTWFVRFDRVTANGTPVSGAFAELRLVKGRIVMIRLETHPQAEVSLPARKFAPAQAITRAHEALAAFVPGASLHGVAGREIIVPIAVGAGWVYRPAFEIETTTADRSGHWRSVVDATYGEVLSRESVNRYAVAGTFTGMVEPRLPGDTLASEPFSFIRPTVGGAAVTADGTGAWTSAAATGSAVTTKLSGAFVNVSNQSGADASASFTAANATGDDYVFTGANASLPEIDGYRHILEARDWALTVIPSNPWLAQQLTVNVNTNDTCNSFWDGSTINLFLEGAQCNNTARIADVVYHEFGHGFQQNITISGQIDGAIGEGTGDYLSATITNDSRIGPLFFKTGGAVRDIEPDRVYPADLVGEVHEDGLLWGGSMWDLRKALIAKLGSTGTHTTDLLFTKALFSGPTLDQAFDEILLADDDDGNLANGTPNQCEIEAAFGIHGLFGSGALNALQHIEVVGPIASSQAVPLVAQAPASATVSACPGTTITSVDLKYTVDGGAAQVVALTDGASGWGGSIPAIGSDGHVLRYWFESHLDGGSTRVTPPLAPQNSYGFYVGPLVTIWKEDFEHGEDGWTHGGTSDDWAIGTPAGQANDPVAAYSGTNVLGNDLNGSYSPNADNWALSPTIDCNGCRGAHLQLRRWLGVEDATFDHATILVNDVPVYANPVGAGAGGALPKDPLWSFEDYDISQIADGHHVKIKFALTSDQGAEYGGWNVDDVAIVTPGALVAGGGGKGCGCDLGGDATAATALVPSLLAVGALIVRRRRTI